MKLYWQPDVGRTKDLPDYTKAWKLPNQIFRKDSIPSSP
jgi:hypothetical protein